MASKDGKQLGMYSWDADGADGRWEGNWSDVAELKDYGYGMDNFFYDLMLLTENEKTFKRVVRKGFVGVAQVDECGGAGTWILQLAKNYNHEKVMEYCKKTLRPLPFAFSIIYYTELKDFDVVEMKPKPEWMNKTVQ